MTATGGQDQGARSIGTLPSNVVDWARLGPSGIGVAGCNSAGFVASAVRPADFGPVPAWQDARPLRAARISAARDKRRTRRAL